ncbi:MAG: glycosyl hydrolase 108 family protein, partial [Chitinophagaceae bacterium]
VYAILKGDDGGETFGGISRVYVPEWSGWSIIDAVKKNYKNGIIPNNTKIPMAEAAVVDYYEEYIWRRKGQCHLIKNQQVANLVFDACVQHGKAARIINAACKDAGFIIKMEKTKAGKIVPLNKITGDTLNCLNSVPQIVYPLIWLRREAYYKADDDWDKFGKGWMNRLNSFPKGI